MAANESRPRQGENEMIYVEKIKNVLEAAHTHQVVATLIVTVTFAAGFTLPGGFETDPNSTNKGTAILIRNAAFCTFVVTDVIAFACSAGAMYIYFIMANTRLFKENNSKWYQIVEKLYWDAARLQALAMIAGVIAFVTGMYATLAHSKALTVAICILVGCTSFLVVFRVNFQIFKFPRFLSPLLKHVPLLTSEAVGRSSNIESN